MRPVLAAVCAVGVLCASAVAAQDSAGGTAFKRLSAPAKGQAPKIDVQIDPDVYFKYFNPDPIDEAVPQKPEPTPEVQPDKPYQAFWDYLDAQRAPGAPVSTDVVIEALKQASVPQPRLQAMQQIANDFAADILLGSVGTRVSPALVLAVISVESSGKPDALSSAGAMGLMQLIPATAERFGVEDATDPKQNIGGGIAYLDWLIQEFNADAAYVLAGYNAGENAVKRNGGVPPFNETLAYVPKVLSAWQVARGLCMTPPELITDGCVLRTTKEAS